MIAIDEPTLPPGAVNPAEFVIDLVSIDHESQMQAMKDLRLRRLRIEVGGTIGKP